jgi:hypothetical protein
MNKIRLVIWISLIAFAVAEAAVTITITIPTQDAQRVSNAFGNTYGLGRPASGAEVTEIIRRWIIQTVENDERVQTQLAYSPTPMVMQPTPTPSATFTPSATATATFTPTPTATEAPSDTPTPTP